MKTIITLQRNMDNGYGTVYCIQKQDFELSNIHNYFETNQPFDSIESLVSYLEKKLDNDDYDFLYDIMCSLDESDESEHFHSTSNPNSFGNNVDNLIVSYQGNVIFEN